MLRPVTDAVVNEKGYYNPVLLRKGPLSSLYRISRAGKYFAVKAASEGSGRMPDLIRREYEISIGLSHPFIASVFVFEEDTPVGPGIIMEYVDGRSLSEFLA